MKFTTKMRMEFTLLMSLVIAVSLILFMMPILNKENMNKHFHRYINSDRLKSLTITDVNGVKLYNGGYVKGETLRRSTFHLIGDKESSVPTSVLATYQNSSGDISPFTGYKSEKTDIKLTIDSKLQQAAYNKLIKNNVNGTIVVVNYKTGAIVCMTSTPSVDPKDKSEVAANAYLNKAINAYTPGSVFKAVSVGALLKKDPFIWNTYSYNCTGTDGKVKCVKAHGYQTLEECFYHSCNCGIATCVENNLTADEFTSFVKETGILSTDYISDIAVKKGTFDANDSIRWSANGQSKDTITPAALAYYYSAIANGGKVKTLYVRDGHEKLLSKRHISMISAQRMVTALSKAVESYGSPIHCSAFGKTGTAETGKGTTHSWFACGLTDSSAPDYVVVTMLEEAGSSSLAVRLTANLINESILRGN